MALETGDFIGELDPANPPGADPKSQGDDHIRLIKHTLQGTFGDMLGLWELPTNSVWIKESNLAASGFINMIRVNAGDLVEIGANLTLVHATPTILLSNDLAPTLSFDRPTGTSYQLINDTGIFKILHGTPGIGAATDIAIQLQGGDVSLLTGNLKVHGANSEFVGPVFFSDLIGNSRFSIDFATNAIFNNTDNSAVQFQSQGNTAISYTNALAVTLAGAVSIAGALSMDGKINIADAGVGAAGTTNTAQLGVAAAAGLQLIGHGTNFDFTLYNQLATVVMTVTQNSTTVNFSGDVNLTGNTPTLKLSNNTDPQVIFDRPAGTSHRQVNESGIMRWYEGASGAINTLSMRLTGQTLTVSGDVVAFG